MHFKLFGNLPEMSRRIACARCVTTDVLRKSDPGQTSLKLLTGRKWGLYLVVCE